MAEKDSEYVHSSTALSSFVALNETASLFVKYYMLFDEIKANINYLSFNVCVCIYIYIYIYIHVT